MNFKNWTLSLLWTPLCWAWLCCSRHTSGEGDIRQQLGGPRPVEVVSLPPCSPLYPHWGGAATGSTSWHTSLHSVAGAGLGQDTESCTVIPHQPCTEQRTLCFAPGRWAPPKLSSFPGINCCYTIPLPALGSWQVTDDFYPDWDKVPADIAVLYKIYIIPPKSWILVLTHKENWWKSMKQHIFPLTDSEPTNINLIHILKK